MKTSLARTAMVLFLRLTTLFAAASVIATLAIPSPAQTVTTLHSFTGADGALPAATLIQARDGNFYGTTDMGGTYGDGTVFRITPTGALTSLHSFNYIDGSQPSTLLQAKDGNFYGTTYYGGTSSGHGTVFQITPKGALTTLHSFSYTDGYSPCGGLVQGRDGNFYGTTFFGGTYGQGNVFQISPSGTLASLYSFTGGSDGASPCGGLVQGSDGNFYGTTENGGTSRDGTVFKITPRGALTSLHRFDGTDGSLPAAVLVQGTDGNFYGTTAAGGGTTGMCYYFARGCGTVFQITATGTFTTLHNFTGTDGYSIFAGLVQGTDGNFYGPTQNGGSAGTTGLGTLFQITSTGALTTLHRFTGGRDGAGPLAGLVQGTDGNFYGTTFIGGASSDGTVFQLKVGVATQGCCYHSLASPNQQR